MGATFFTPEKRKEMIGQEHEPGASDICATDICKAAIGSNQVVVKTFGSLSSLCRKHAVLDEE